MKVNIFWFRRDLRLEDNVGLQKALDSDFPVIPIFIFDDKILENLPKDDARLCFIYDCLDKINKELKEFDSSLLCRKGNPIEVWKTLITKFEIQAVFTNKDYETYAIQRDKKVEALLKSNNIPFNAYKDQVVFEENEVTKADGLPYTVYTPYKNKWIEKFKSNPVLPIENMNYNNFCSKQFDFPSLIEIGFERSNIKVKGFDISNLDNYSEARDFPAKDEGSYLSPHLRFGTINPRTIIHKLKNVDSVFVSELIWREFFMQILFHFPKVVTNNFKAKYDNIKWRNNKAEFEKWCNGETGYPLVDAGMRQLNETGYMHNRVRMVVASFLIKHLLIHWSWGEAYFAEKLLDYDLSANNGNWQWAAGTGCDAAPYFRVFNPITQFKKFDKDFKYVRKWVPEFEGFNYPKPMVDHKMARERVLEAYKTGLNT
ncbi:MAG: cryptochrome/photolyase family protein [Chitinophagales bacterium]